MKTVHYACVLFILLALSACAGASSTSATATPVDIGALQTAAVQTVVADITQTAAAQPSPTPTEANTPAPAPTQAPTATVTAAVSPTAPLCDDAAFVSDASVPDGSQITAGTAFIKTWKVKNTGTCAWGTAYQIRWSHGEKMSGASTALSAAVQPGETVEVSINLKAPAKAGTYGGYWRLFNNNGYAFGMYYSVIIVVP
jgi:hypothetical protein